MYKTVILGSGPAGLTAGIYAARAGLKPLLIKGLEAGGQLTQTPEIGNWPGAFDNPSGYDLIDKLTLHAQNLGVEFKEGEAVSCNLTDGIKTLTLDDGSVIETKTLIIATGARARYLEVKGEENYKGRGVSACATCDGFFFRGKTVAVVGGGSAAFTEALYLASICKKVYLIHRREGFRAEAILVDKLKALSTEGKVEFILNAKVKEVKGDENQLTSIVLDLKGQDSELALDGLFVAVGHVPATSIFKESLSLDEGYIKVGLGKGATSTNIKGVYACGDCADKVYRQAITSAGTGCMAALDAEHYLLDN